MIPCKTLQNLCGLNYLLTGTTPTATLWGYWDAQGNVVAEYTYDAFGKMIASSGPMADVFAIRYSTKYFDPETGLYYYGYRYYSPELMRWVTRDPIGEEGGVNLFDEFIIKTAQDYNGWLFTKKRWRTTNEGCYKDT